MKITIEDIRYALTAAVVEKERLEQQLETLSGKLRKMLDFLARETRVTASVDVFVDWEMPDLALEAIQAAKMQLARELVEEIMERDLFVTEIDEQKTYRRLKAEIRVLRPKKDREVV